MFAEHLTLARQPIVSAHSQPTRYELLLRLKTPDGLATAFPIIQECESFGSIALLDQWVFEQAFRLLETTEDSYNINISLDSLNGGNTQNLVSFIWESVRSGKVDPARLGLELVERYEHSLTGRTDLYSLILYLKQRGCRVVLDDFGEGRHSLRDLISTIQPTSIKIDGSFVREIATNPQSRELVWHLIRVAKLYGIETTAEGVESREVYDVAIELGFDWLQGYYLGMPEEVAIK